MADSSDYFATLGGSLMKDLLADLQVEDGDWSLEQLEKELANMEQQDSQPAALLPDLSSAASMVVSHAQQQQQLQLQQQQQHNIAAPSAPAGMDAWSLSLEKFTSLSLEQDFLAADTVRKQQKQQFQEEQSQPRPPPGMMSSDILATAEDYDISEKATVAPPPGLSGLVSPNDILSSLSGVVTTTTTTMPPPPPGVTQGPTSHQSQQTRQTQPPPPTAPMQVAQPSRQPQVLPPGIPPPPQQQQQQKPPGMATSPPQQQKPPQPQMQQPPGMPQPPVPTPPPRQPPPPQMMPQPGMPPPPGPHVPIATPAVGPAWQRAPPPNMVPPVNIRVFCNPHPSAPPIAATMLESKIMTARDISYVIHSILKPVLVEGVSDGDYHIEFLRRLGGPANPNNPKRPKDVQREMASRSNKTKEWANQHAVLGHVAKTNVARPRALIATPVGTTDQDSEQRNRASLWKSRIYVDQAYQSYLTVVNIWKTAAPGTVPPQLQLHLVKLMKCLGISLVGTEFTVDTTSLQLVLKLGKGCTLMARILEQTLLPPNAVYAVLPEVLQILLPIPCKSEDIADHRLFRAIAGVVRKLPFSIPLLIQNMSIIQANGNTALTSPPRMECIHAFLQRGTTAAAKEPSAELQSQWKTCEDDFMALLANMK